MDKFKNMSESNRLTHIALNQCKDLILSRETITKEEVEIFVKLFLTKNNVISAFKGLYGFPSELCISLNDEAIHGIADDTVIKKGDIVSLDFGVIYEGYNSDAAITFINSSVINPLGEKAKLVKATRLALEESVVALNASFPDCRISDISKTIERVGKNYSIVGDFGGHGIGETLHDSRIFVPNVYNPDAPEFKLVIGDYFTIEPIFTLGSSDLVASDKGAYVTDDGSLSAHFEYSLALTKQGIIILK